MHVSSRNDIRSRCGKWVGGYLASTYLSTYVLLCISAQSPIVSDKNQPYRIHMPRALGTSHLSFPRVFVDRGELGLLGWRELVELWTVDVGPGLS
ncbi:hypothetical protein BO71DRAFT_397079 [Aspergillus ellipticus CBS 707.79]|uniref:Uncharacterized protein n=1 Tax=Aspergillus ellipticus CBS 707.79 TaxID=1448320 RepID=A0A319DHF2_9EURO|nr:hypothetical protein BO71DRAFT_397079 [Aspergillus ellipticus CBS 707.79]